MKKFQHKPILKEDIVLDRIQDDNFGRFYQSPTTKEWYPSVTTVTGYASKAFFDQWKKDKNNLQKSNTAARIGEELHEIVENYLNNQNNFARKKSLISVNLFENLKDHLYRIDNITIQEKSLYSDYLRMAGRLDCVAEYDGVLSIIDFKTSSKFKKEEYIQNYFEQATAYSLMYEEMFKIPVKQIVIMITTLEGEIQIFKKNPKNYYLQLNNTIKNYWKNNNYHDIQNTIKG